ncbi:unnamed protein product [Oncorhynchus mykiss]|uniref:Myeloperoxidase n=1 Tax=Oncorhynchus mykiss TaxID=8022 RepID=A0A060XS99_ONCMY|nr:unnamed protein product [Oncorhynchus mykiss]
MKPFSSLLALGQCLMFIQPALSTQESLGGPFIHSSIEEAKRLVDEAYKYSREKSLERVRGQSIRPSDVLRLLKQPARDTRSAVRSADYLENTLRLIHEKVHRTHRLHKRSLNATDLLTPQELDTIARVTGCAARVSKPSCRTTPNVNKYRTATSVCNNLKSPRLGASNTPFTRWLPAQYDDGVSRPKSWDPNRSFNNFVLPLVREVSNRILATNDASVESDREFTHMVTIFGQWNDHDLTFTPSSPSIRAFSNGLDCDESCERSEPCFPIQIPLNDPRLPTGPDSCIPVFRSAPVCGTGKSAFNFGDMANRREQINALNAFLDLGQVYGSEEGLARDLRDLTNDGGLLRINKEFTDNGREFLPFTDVKGNMCATRRRITNDTNAKEVPCFVAGDVRVDENIALTSIHTMFLREHNRLAGALLRLNPHWDGETLYQEARKIMGAYTQVPFHSLIISFLFPNLDYNAWRKFCGLSTPSNLGELAVVLNNTDLAFRLLQLYGTPDNIDVWMGGVAEPFVHKGRVGPLFACLIATQFQKIRQGDRLWYENPGVFTSAQRKALKNVSLAQIICDNTDITAVSRDPFLIPEGGNTPIKCNNIQQLNLSAWKESASTADQKQQENSDQDNEI